MQDRVPLGYLSTRERGRHTSGVTAEERARVARVVVAEVRWPVVSGSLDLCGGEVASGQWTSSIFVEVRWPVVSGPARFLWR
jgi:hypothetical protein